MFNFFKQNKETAIKEVWKELCELDNFLNQKLGKFIESQTHLEVSQWEFVNKPLATLERQRPNIKFELYEFAKNEIFIKTLQTDINKLLDILRQFLSARQIGDQGKMNAQIFHCNNQIKIISTNYLRKLNEFREMAEKLTNESFYINTN